MGQTPLRSLPQAPGTDAVVFSRPGYFQEQRDVVLQAGHPTILNVGLIKAGRLIISGDTLATTLYPSEAYGDVGFSFDVDVLPWLRVGAELRGNTLYYDYTMTMPQGINATSQTESLSGFSVLATADFIPFPWIIAPYVGVSVGALVGSQNEYSFLGVTSQPSSTLVLARGDVILGFMLLTNSWYEASVYARFTVIQPYDLTIRQFDFWGEPKSVQQSVFSWIAGVGISMGIAL